MVKHVTKSEYKHFETELSSHLKALEKEAKKIKLEDSKIGSFLATLFQEDPMPETSDQIIVREWQAIDKMRGETLKGYDQDSRYILEDLFKNTIADRFQKITGSYLTWDIDDDDYHAEMKQEVSRMVNNSWLNKLVNKFSGTGSSSKGDLSD